MKVYMVHLVCGCCQGELHFSSPEAIATAFENAGLTSSGTITDELGNVVEDIDTFYGYSEKGVVDPRGKLEKLFDQL